MGVCSSQDNIGPDENMHKKIHPHEIDDDNKDSLNKDSLNKDSLNKDSLNKDTQQKKEKC
eukprot:TRINITY_DN7478_c0_g1_i1.p2 TRINITY_DN7478_c0_g1~~TRINITY_DN7478_c0_g1_i1.p2  ORF type:complete len:60 (+),score=14.54 TRINITY_DN7478_c0_g1_i1:186-365(+)